MAMNLGTAPINQRTPPRTEAPPLRVRLEETFKGLTAAHETATAIEQALGSVPPAPAGSGAAAEDLVGVSGLMLNIRNSLVNLMNRLESINAAL